MELIILSFQSWRGLSGDQTSHRHPPRITAIEQYPYYPEIKNKTKFRSPLSGTKIKDQKMLPMLYHTGNYKGFKSHVSRTRGKDQFIFFYDLRAAFKK